MKTILVTGACGYKGNVLVPKLLQRGYGVIAMDNMWFGNNLPAHSEMKVINKDIRQITQEELEGVDVIIHLASVANDPCGDMDPQLTWEISALGTMQLVDKAVRAGVRQFVYASSGSVYGVKDDLDVVEDLELEPISEYNKTKMVAERVLLSYQDKLVLQVVRPATVCGFSPRMRLDVAVNMLTMQALTKGKITVFGGDQLRPNIHIEDITDIYLYLLEHSDISGVYNAGFENITILEIAKLVTKYVPAEIVVTASNDPRSYRVNSDKLLASGYKPKKTVENAIQEMVEKYHSGMLKDEERSYNLKWMQKTIFDGSRES